MNLLMAPVDVDLRIIKIRKVQDKSQNKQLSNLGFVMDATVKVISDIDGNLIVSIKGSRVALGRELASKIQVIVL